MNLWQLSQIVDKLASERKGQQAGEKIVVDLKGLGFKKLLGSGSILRAVEVRVDECSEGALKKIRDAGGEAVLKATSTPPTAPK